MGRTKLDAPAESDSATTPLGPGTPGTGHAGVIAPSQERSAALLCALYFFLAMSSYYIMKALRESFFLQTQSYEHLPKVHLWVTAMTFVAAQAYAALAVRFSGRKLVAFTNMLFVACVLAFWIVLSRPGHSQAFLGWLSWIFYVWVSVFSVFVVTLFWSQAHAVFTPEQGSRLYGIIGAGGILGAAVGGMITRQLVHHFGSVNLLLIAAGLLSPCILIGLRLSGREAQSPVAAAPVAKTPVLKLFFDNPYVCGIGLLVLLYQIIGVFVDYQIHALVQDMLKNQDDRTAFFGEVFLFANLLGLFIGVVVAGPVQSRWGPLPGLISLPLLSGVSAAVFCLHPSVKLATVICVLALGVQYSIHQSSRELLYLPTTTEVKFVAKGFIDTFLFRAGNGAAAVSLLLAPTRIGVVEVSYRVMPIALVMGITAIVMDREYRKRIHRTETTETSPPPVA